jgi:hypothetical protein
MFVQGAQPSSGREGCRLNRQFPEDEEFLTAANSCAPALVAFNRRIK